MTTLKEKKKEKAKETYKQRTRENEKSPLSHYRVHKQRLDKRSKPLLGRITNL